MDKIAVFVMYDRAIDEEVLAALAGCGLERFTRWHDATGVGATGPHLGDNVWPALNNVLLVVAEAEKKDEILRRIRSLQEQFPFTGLRAVVVPALDMV
jgi:hypothetical protein